MELRGGYSSQEFHVRDGSFSMESSDPKGSNIKRKMSVGITVSYSNRSQGTCAFQRNGAINKASDTTAVYEILQVSQAQVHHDQAEVQRQVLCEASKAAMVRYERRCRNKVTSAQQESTSHVRFAFCEQNKEEEEDNGDRDDRTSPKVPLSVPSQSLSAKLKNAIGSLLVKSDSMALHSQQQTAGIISINNRRVCSKEKTSSSKSGDAFSFDIEVPVRRNPVRQNRQRKKPEYVTSDNEDFIGEENDEGNRDAVEEAKEDCAGRGRIRKTRACSKELPSSDKSNTFFFGIDAQLTRDPVLKNRQLRRDPVGKNRQRKRAKYVSSSDEEDVIQEANNSDNQHLLEKANKESAKDANSQHVAEEPNEDCDGNFSASHDQDGKTPPLYNTATRKYCFSEEKEVSEDEGKTRDDVISFSKRGSTESIETPSPTAIPSPTEMASKGETSSRESQKYEVSIGRKNDAVMSPYSAAGLIQHNVASSEEDDEENEDSIDLHRAVKQFCTLLQNFRRKLNSETENKISSVLATVTKSFQKQLDDVRGQIQSDLIKYSKMCDKKYSEMELSLQDEHEKLKSIHEKFKSELTQHFQVCESIISQVEEEQLELRAIAERQKMLHRKLVIELQEKMETELSDAQKKIDSVRKAASNHMDVLKRVLKEMT